ncbi:hypothetical protein FL966_04320 [Caproiciproducens galactitolivorans]|uniref:Flagellar hook-length control protein FliK n=1 Tax=Caproiciproducens galactitolivorans TaxID=642589 RepID=A0A4Z0YMK4_9FIRM|nr:flagellar hook-length control protein FliK [Caproiciproducens galactitolivorans]QEY34341.1 hypothetical protein FL966_04320 [Caproiciproducens galactitolivorans]TGJ77892.1 flagellar hook-length control protein FliK [Caproiciproducens galactitolivorans]
MIQQITTNVASSAALQKTKTAQAKKDGTGSIFESLLQQSGKTITKENSKQTSSVPPKDEKNLDNITGMNQQTIQPNITPFAPICQAPAFADVPDVLQPQVGTQAVSFLPASGLQADSKQVVMVHSMETQPAFLQSVGTQAENAISEKVAVGNGFLQSNGKPDAPVAQLASSNPTAAKAEVPVQPSNSVFTNTQNSTLQKEPAVAMEPSMNGFNRPTAAQAELPKQDGKVLPKQESAFAVGKLDQVKPEKQAATELPSAESDKLPMTAEDKKETIPIHTASQSNARLSSLYENGNVVIKISDAKASGKALSTQLTDKVLYNYKQGNHQFTMELYPKNLGKVSIKLAMQDGVLSVTIQAANPKTQSLLLENSADIKAILQTSVNQPVQINEAAHDRAWYEQGQQNQQNQPQQEREQKQNVRLPLDDSNGSTDDFITVMQQLRNQVSAM